jgi:hypothetical protein
MPSRNWVGPAMQDPWDRADHYREEAMKCHELAKHAELAYLGEFYRRVAVRYMFMAEGILNEARARGEIADQTGRRAALNVPGGRRA